MMQTAASSLKQLSGSASNLHRGCSRPKNDHEIWEVKTVAVVPVKSLDQAKTRLASILSPEERALLARDMLSHVLDALLSSTDIDGVAVISPNPGELRLSSSV